MNISIGKLGALFFGISEKHCEWHTNILKTLETAAIQQTKNAAHIAQNTKELEEGREEFKDVREAISKINYNIAYLTGKSDQRRETDCKEEEDDG